MKIANLQVLPRINLVQIVNSDVPIWRKVEKSAIFCHFKRIKGDKRRLRIFFKNPLGTFLSPIHVLLNCKVSIKSNERFSINCVTNERTDGRTDGWTNVIPQVSFRLTAERPKSNERFPRKSVADERTNGRTDVQTRLLRSQRPVGRETKNLIFKPF